MKEEWKNVEGFKGLYQVSNLGNVKSLNYNNSGKEQILKQSIRNSNGSKCVTLCRNGKRQNYSVHRLVATAFLQNPFNYKEVNHKDENRHNNNVMNLEWCNRTYNNNYGTRNQRTAAKLGKPLLCKKDGVITYYDSCHDAGKALNIPYQSIQKVCNGVMKQSHGYTFHYIGE